MIEPIKTNVVLVCNSLSLGQVTLYFTSSKEFLKNSTTLFIINLLFAQAPGLEPRLMVLETTVLPLNYACKFFGLKIGLQK